MKHLDGALKPFLNKKAEIVIDKYDGNDPLKRKVASTLLESFCFTLDSTGLCTYHPDLS